MRDTVVCAYLRAAGPAGSDGCHVQYALGALAYHSRRRPSQEIFLWEEAAFSVGLISLGTTPSDRCRRKRPPQTVKSQRRAWSGSSDAPLMLMPGFS